MATFVKSQGVVGWTWSHMSECWVMEIMDGPYLVALVWYNWAPGTGKVLECHAAATKKYRGHWRPPIATACFFNMVHVTGCNVLFAQCPEPLQKNVWRKLGFEITGDFATLDVREWHNGWSE
jgi:hypothetical protein